VVVTYAMVDGCVTLFSHSTAFIMTVMSIERWLHMARRSLINVRRAFIIVVSLFLLPIPVTVYRVLQRLKRAPTPVVDVISSSLVPFLLTVSSVAYLKVFRIIRRHQQQIRANGMSQNFAQPAINFTKYKKSVFTILIILAVFYITYLPVILTISLLWVLLQNPNLKELILRVSILLGYLASSLNPLIFIWRMKDIRNEVITLLKGMFCKSS